MNKIKSPFNSDMESYEHISQEATVTVELTAQEVAVIFAAYDYGTDALDSEQRDLLRLVIAKMKDQLHP